MFIFSKNMNYNSISPKVKLPTSVVRGSFKRRTQIARQYSDKLFEDLYPRFLHGKVSFDRLQKSVDSVIGKKGTISVIKYPYDKVYAGAQDVNISEYTGKISGYTLEVNTDKKALDMSDFPTIIHEFQHCVDMLCNPKYASRYQKLSSAQMYGDKYNTVAENLFFELEPEGSGHKYKARLLNKIEYKFKSFLKDLPFIKKVDYIQDMRYELQSELNAYQVEHKYVKRLKRKRHEILKSDLADGSKTLLLKEKIKLLNRIGNEYIKKERLKLASQYHKKLKAAGDKAP